MLDTSVRAATERTPFEVSFWRHVVYRGATTTAGVPWSAQSRPRTARAPRPAQPAMPTGSRTAFAPPSGTDLRLMPLLYDSSLMRNSLCIEVCGLMCALASSRLELETHGP